VGIREAASEQPHDKRGEAALIMGHPGNELQAAQSFVHTLSACWGRPSLTALEVAWRWLYGIPSSALIVWELRKVLLAATGGTLDPARLGLDRALLNDPVGALSAEPVATAAKFSDAIDVVEPGLWHAAVWMVPLLVVAWVIVSSFGRTLVLRRADGTVHSRPGTLMVLQAIRMVALLTIFWVWFAAIQWSAKIAVGGPVARGDEPNVILYCALVIVLTLGLFTLWAFLSWVFSVAPLLAMLRNLGVRASLVAATRLGPLKGKLVEINLVMGIVKIALIVLAMVFSATPLPFQSATTPEFLAWWCAGVAVLYLLWSDFFHVARLVGYLNLWRAFESQD
jgi:hypothetical protein